VANKSISIMRVALDRACDLATDANVGVYDTYFEAGKKALSQLEILIDSWPREENTMEDNFLWLTQ
jgi:hypothetical protein